MKNKKSLSAILAFILLGLIVWWVWIWRLPPQSAGTNTKNVSSADDEASSQNAKVAQAQLQVKPIVPQISGLQMIMDADNAKPINAYGKVVDQYGDPVEGAEVKGGTLLYAPNGTGGQGVASETDAQGKFSFTGLNGADFGVLISKIGYIYDNRPYLNWYKTYKPDPDNPMVFTMWKLQGAEPMTYAKFGAWIPCDGTPVGIDLFTGKKNATGDLKVTLTRSPLQVKRGGPPFDWNVQIELVGGGLVESSDLYPYEAPEKGYQPVFVFSQPKDTPNWTRKLVQAFYVRTAKGDYGRINVDLTTDSDRPEGTGLAVESWMNPSGSRNLEFDAAKQIKPGG